MIQRTEQGLGYADAQANLPDELRHYSDHGTFTAAARMFAGCTSAAGCYGDWKNEYEGYRGLLKRV